jgi:hypothetical protein
LNSLLVEFAYLKKFSDISSCFDGNPAIGLSILGGKLGLGATTGLPTPWNLLDSLSSMVSMLEMAQLGYDKSAMSILE